MLPLDTNAPLSHYCLTLVLDLYQKLNSGFNPCLEIHCKYTNIHVRARTQTHVHRGTFCLSSSDLNPQVMSPMLTLTLCPQNSA